MTEQMVNIAFWSCSSLEKSDVILLVWDKKKTWARAAPETAHAIKATIVEALRCKETGDAKTILMLMSGHGFFDMAAYEGYMDGKLKPFELPMERINKTMNSLKQLYPTTSRVTPSIFSTQQQNPCIPQESRHPRNDQVYLKVFPVPDTPRLA